MVDGRFYDISIFSKILCVKLDFEANYTVFVESTHGFEGIVVGIL